MVENSSQQADRIFMRHIRAADMCASGTRLWFEKQGFSWRDFLLKGIAIEAFEKTGDALAMRVVEIARREDHG